MHPDVRFAVITDKIADHTCTRNEVERVLRAAHRKGWVLMMAYTEPSYKITSETSGEAGNMVDIKALDAANENVKLQVQVWLDKYKGTSPNAILPFTVDIYQVIHAYEQAKAAN